VNRTAAPGDLERRVEEFRAVRETIEASILPLASSVDGRSFTFQASLHGLDLQPGAYVVLEHTAGSRLGQVLSLALVTEEATAIEQPIAQAGGTARSRVLARLARGEGTILGGDGGPFHDALARPAAPDEVRAWLDHATRQSAQLEVGELALAPGVPCVLDAGGFARHTFMCGQSGSGKTYSLGVVLERLMLETGLRIVVLDPNSDYIHLAEARADVEPTDAARYTEAALGVEVRGAGDGQRLGLRGRDLDADQQAALLRLDPIADREEYAELARLVAEAAPGSFEEVAAAGGEVARQLALRASNLGVDRWPLWSRAHGASVADDLRGPEARCLVVDLGSLDSREEQALVAGTVLRTLWRERARREPVLVVIDEAHNVCPQRPDDELTALATEDAIRIAGEGRKYGIYLLLSTQRPDKLHVNVLSQCDNLLLMRLNSAADLDVVGEAFSFAPPGLLERATAFRQGEALVAGKISSHPALIRFGERFSREGGGDVPATWAARRARPA
jgi:DNA helicase HerA-like ATPase